MTIKTTVRSSGANRSIKRFWVKRNGLWERVRNAYVKTGGIWQQTYAENVALFNQHGVAGCYSGQAGFAVSLYQGELFLTMGAWPTDPPNCQTCDSNWLYFAGQENAIRQSNNTRPYWTNVWNLNLDLLAVGSITETRAPNWPYTQVSYTYRIVKNTANSIQIYRHPTWGTGDTGTSISVGWWANSFDGLAGGDGTTTPFTISWSF